MSAGVMVDGLATLQPHSDSMTNLRSRSQATLRTSCTTVFNFDPPFRGRFRSLGSRTCRVVTLMSAASRLWPRGAKCLRGPSARPLSHAPYDSTKTRKVSRFRHAVPRCATYPAHVILSYWSYRPASQKHHTSAFSGSIQGQSF